MLEHFDRARRSRRTRLVAFVLAVVMLLVPLSAGGPAGAGSASGTRMSHRKTGTPASRAKEPTVNIGQGCPSGARDRMAVR